MGRTNRLRLQEVQGVYDLLGELSELRHGPDPQALYRHLARRLCQLIPAPQAAVTHSIPADHDIPARAAPTPAGRHEPPRLKWVTATGEPESPGRALVDSWARKGAFLEDAPLRDSLQNARPLGLAIRLPLADPETRFSSGRFQDCATPHLHNLLAAYCHRAAPHQFSGLILRRHHDDPPFTTRERRLVQLLNLEIYRMHRRGCLPPEASRSPEPGGAGLPACHPPAPILTDRQEAVLHALLQGETTRRIAQRLHLSRRTIEDHLRQIYRKFRVRSRFELMALFIDHPPQPHHPHCARAEPPTKPRRATGRDASRLDRLQRDLRAAAEVQRLLLPPPAGQWGRHAYQAVNRPGQLLSGDFYDLIPIGEDQLVATLGDVVGKGAQASMLMTVVEGFVQASLSPGHSLLQAVDSLNRYLVPRCKTDRFVTMWIGLFDAPAATLQYIDAGHSYAFRLTPAGRVEELSQGGGRPLGIDATTSYQLATTNWNPGDRVILVSDGVAEQPRGHPHHTPRQPFGVESIRDLASHPAPAALDEVDHLLHALTAHAGGPRFHDDVTILCIHHVPAPATSTPAPPTPGRLPPRLQKLPT